MARSSNQRLYATYILVGIMFIINAIVTVMNVKTLAANDGWVNHTREVLVALERTLSLVRDAETGQRGYLLTGDGDYLGPYHASTAGMAKALDRLATLTADNPARQGQIARLRRVIAEKFEEMGQTVSLREEEKLDRALEIIRSDRGRRLMVEARGLIEAMREEEGRLLDRRLAAARVALVRTVATFALASGLILLLLFLVGYLHRRDELSRRRSEEALRLLAAIVASSDDAIIGKTLDGIITTWNAGAERIYGYSAAEAIGRPIAMLVPPDRRDEEPAILERLRRGESLDHFATVRVRKDGRRIDVSLTVSPIKDAAGRIVGASKIARDITRQKRAEEKFRLAVESAPNAMVMIDPAGRIVLVNAQAEKVFDYDRAELLGRPIELLVPERLRGKHPANRAAFFAHPEARPMGVGRDLSGRRKDGGEFPVEIGLNPIETEDGLLVLSAIVDITGRKRAERELARRAEELARSNEELERFAYVASHDLQEPLRMVSSYIQLLARRYQGRLDADADDFIAFAVDGVTRMHQLINDLLDYSRVERQGRAFAPVPVADVLARALANLRAAVVESGAEVTHDPLPTVPGDAGQLTRLFQNLIGNAIKYRRAEPPRVHLSACREGAEWHFAVRDNGIGIDPQDAGRIFEVFQRLHGRDKYPGTGIGLAICKKIVERHGGRIWVESRIGMGATFHFTIPAQAGRDGGDGDPSRGACGVAPGIDRRDDAARN